MKKHCTVFVLSFIAASSACVVDAPENDIGAPAPASPVIGALPPAPAPLSAAPAPAAPVPDAAAPARPTCTARAPRKGNALARHAVLFYLPYQGARGQVTANRTLDYAAVRPLIAYTDRDGHASDWLFDGMVFVSTDLYAHTPAVSQDDLLAYERNLFGGLADVALAVRELRVALCDPEYRLRVYLEVPYIPALAAGASAIPGVDALRAKWATTRYPELELAGFYWGYQETSWATYGPTIIARTAAHLHAVTSLEVIGIPSWGGTAGAAAWRSFGFDRMTPQPNYARNYPVDAQGHGAPVDEQRFAAVNDAVRNAGFAGTEVELDRPNNPHIAGTAGCDAECTSAESYLAAARRYGWDHATAAPLTTYYYGNVIGSRYAAPSATPSERRIYDDLYAHVQACAAR